ncbi:DUF5719 family protein [Nocardiopsis lambiniae]|uniref:DUF5719 family protein n=1 Tax=Nocardiopsis lambiniae TaxID=3075539 RepID=A0ABU2MGD0_9ACTN|nr:DUF5719 family protein [Nocardiopsis sp. DSM 44743]MDT0331632.1 DUF5719 family protein [Nocardiopsis sp. DSM 44743]
MRLIVENRFALFGLVALALAALFGIALITGPVTAELGVTRPGTVRPTHALRVCPAPHDTDADSVVAAYAPRVSRDDTGELWAVPVPPVPEEGDAEEGDATAGEGESEDAGTSGNTSGDPDLILGEELTEPGNVWSVDTDGATGPTAIHARGSLASGLESGQVTVTEDGVTEVRCAEPSVSTWFALPGGGDSEGVRLESVVVHLTNPETSRATVSLDIHTSGGPSYSLDSRGISMLPGESTTLDITELSQSIGGIGVQVRTSTGRVAASLLAEHVEGPVDWVPPTAAPALEHVVPGVPPGAGRRHLIVTAPGDDPASVRVHVITSQRDEADEEDASEGAAADPLELQVPPAASARISLDTALGGAPGTVMVESDVPVVVGVAAEFNEEDGAGDDRPAVLETAYTSSVPPLSFPLNTTAVLPDVPVGTDTRLVLGAPEGDVRLMATPIGADGTQGDSVRTEVAAGTTVLFGGDDGWTSPSGTDEEDGYAVRLDLLEGSGPLYVARIIADGDGRSVLPVRPAPVEVALPVVRDTMVGVVP